MRWSRRSQDESSHGVFCEQRTSAARGAALPSNAAAAGDTAAAACRRQCCCCGPCSEGRSARRGPPSAARAARRGWLHKAAEVTHGNFGALNLSLGWNRELGLGLFAGARSLGEGQEPGRFLDCLRQSPFLLFLVTVDCAVSHSKKKYPGRTCVPPRESSRAWHQAMWAFPRARTINRRTQFILCRLFPSHC